jgi:hypothetical protein
MSAPMRLFDLPTDILELIARMRSADARIDAQVRIFIRRWRAERAELVAHPPTSRRYLMSHLVEEAYLY